MASARKMTRSKKNQTACDSNTSMAAEDEDTSSLKGKSIRKKKAVAVSTHPEVQAVAVVVNEIKLPEENPGAVTDAPKEPVEICWYQREVIRIQKIHSTAKKELSVEKEERKKELMDDYNLRNKELFADLARQNEEVDDEFEARSQRIDSSCKEKTKEIALRRNLDLANREIALLKERLRAFQAVALPISPTHAPTEQSAAQAGPSVIQEATCFVRVKNIANKHARAWIMEIFNHKKVRDITFVEASTETEETTEAIVEFGNEADAAHAITKNGVDVQGRSWQISPQLEYKSLD